MILPCFGDVSAWQHAAFGPWEAETSQWKNTPVKHLGNTLLQFFRNKRLPFCDKIRIRLLLLKKETFILKNDVPTKSISHCVANAFKPDWKIKTDQLSERLAASQL